MRQRLAVYAAAPISRRSQTSWRREKITTGGSALFSAFGGPSRASGPSQNDSGCKTGPGERVHLWGSTL
eukprot:4184895-Pyramimonas_sp.AAC.1